MIQVFKSYVQPLVQYGILIYVNSVLSDISLIDSKLKILIRIIFNRITFSERSKKKIYSVFSKRTTLVLST